RPMNVFAEFTSRLNRVVERIGEERFNIVRPDLSNVKVEPPRDPAHGDLAANAAMVLAKVWGVPPRELATHIAAALANDPDVATAEVAGPGFINLRLTEDFW